MSNKQKLFILGTGMVCGAILAALLFFMFPVGKSKNSEITHTPSQSVSSDKHQISTLNQQLQEAEQALKASKSGKDDQNFTQLQTVSQKLFDIYYNYDQSKMTNEKRQDEAKKLATTDVLNQLFPLSADQQTSDYGAIQSKLNGVQVFTQKQSGTSLTALVDCNYSVQAGDMTSTVPHYLFQVTYDTNTGQITQVNEWGKAGK